MKTDQKVRVRFAPSPTGFQHIGGLRTALYNYLFAAKRKGVFILRIEDTDQKRYVEGAVENTIDFHQRFGLTYKEGPVRLQEKGEAEGSLSTRYHGVFEIGPFGPYIQSERLELYKKHAEQLVQDGKAYYCFCTEERLTELRQKQIERKEAARYDRRCATLTAHESNKRRAAGEAAVIRFRVPDGRGLVECQDLIHGAVSFESSLLDDFVLLKSDGFPTYHLAVVVDDHLMEISHIFRTVEWLPSLPKHVLVYEAFGWPMPPIAHLPTILGSDGKKKLSKRDGDVSVEYFESAGYLREALLNFVALLGWNPGKGSTQEIFSLEELIEQFDLANVHRAGAVFDRKKLDWMNHQYIAKKNIQELLTLVRQGNFLEREDFYTTASPEYKTDAYLLRVLTIEQERLNRLSDVGAENHFFFTDEFSYPSSLLHWKKNTPDETKKALENAKTILQGIEQASWTREYLAETLLAAAGEKKGDLLWPLRVALTGKEKSPSPMEVAWVIGPAKTNARIEKALLLLEETST